MQDPRRYSIRAFEAADLIAISRVHWRACRIAYRFMGWSYTEDEVRQWYAGKIHEWDWAHLACLDGRIVAFIAAIGAHVDQLFVDPDHQRSGLGSALLAAALDRKLRPATLHVFAENAPARAFYERFGFRQADAWWDERDRTLCLLYRSDQRSYPDRDGPQRGR